MSRRNFTDKQRKQRQEFASGTVGLTFRQEVHTTQFEQLLGSRGVTEANCHENEECATWCRVNKDRRYIPERVLYRLRTKSLYEEEQAPFSLIDNMLVPEPKPLEETEEVGDEPQTQELAA